MASSNASAYHFFNSTDFDNTPDRNNASYWKILWETPGRLRVIENEILGVIYGAGTFHVPAPWHPAFANPPLAKDIDKENDNDE